VPGSGASSLTPTVQVIPASQDQEPVIANLLELYAHDFSALLDLRLGPDGRFGYPTLPLFWREEGRSPFLIRADRELAGVALVTRGSRIGGDPLTWDMTEFFVVRSFRGQGVGSRAAGDLWRRLPGRWEIRVLELNEPALAFWAAAIRRFTRSPPKSVPIEVGAKRWHLFSFRSPHGEA
jgi:predicted acetyltransferase